VRAEVRPAAAVRPCFGLRSWPDSTTRCEARSRITRYPRHPCPAQSHPSYLWRAVFASPRGRLQIHFVGMGEFLQEKRETARLWLGR
jgi:hypothetical protein